MKYQAIQIDQAVRDLLGDNLVVVASGRRSAPDLDFIWKNEEPSKPTDFLLNNCTLKQGPATILERKDRNLFYTILPGTSSKWIVYEGTPGDHTAFWLLSEGDPLLEICEWNTIREVSFDQETRTATFVNTGTINGVPMLDSPFNKTGKSVIIVTGLEDGNKFIANIDEEGNESINLNSGSSRQEFVKIMFPVPGEVADVDLLSVDDTIDAEGVDLVFTDTDPMEEYLFIMDLIGLKGKSDYYEMPRLLIPLSEIEAQWQD